MYKLTNENWVWKLPDTRIATTDSPEYPNTNLEYLDYKEWLAAGNVPEPADPPTPPVYTCSPWQIRKALNNLNLRQSVESAVAESSDQTIKDGWQYATEFRSDDPFVIAMGQEIGKTPEETAELIQYAGTL